MESNKYITNIRNNLCFDVVAFSNATYLLNNQHWYVSTELLTLLYQCMINHN